MHGLVQQCAGRSLHDHINHILIFSVSIQSDMLHVTVGYITDTLINQHWFRERDDIKVSVLTYRELRIGNLSIDSRYRCVLLGHPTYQLGKAQF